MMFLFRFIRAAVNGLLALIGLGWLLSLGGVLYFTFRDAPVKANAIVVLGAAQYAGKPSPVLKARLDHALQLWQADTSRVLVLTGGTGTGDVTSEAEVSRRYMLQHGVPSRKVSLETQGRTTSESMTAAAAILRARKDTSVALVSDPFHMFRLWLLARRHGLDAVTSPTRTSPITMKSTRNLGYILNESFKAPVALFLE